MKWIYLLFIAIIGCGAGSCNHNSSGSASDDSTVNRVIPPASDNSQATNPSLADTAYPKKDTMITRGDSARSNK
jgi:hypothetical protein